MGIPSNNILAKMRDGVRTRGCALTFPSNNLVEMIGLAELDFLYLDGEHGSFSPNEIEDMRRVAELYGLTTVARVPDIRSSTILTYLDRGVMGIEGLHVTTGEDAEQIVNACYFSPTGSRGISFSRGARYGTAGATSEYTQKLNREMFVFALLEDVRVLDDIDGVLSGRWHPCLSRWHLRPGRLHGPPWQSGPSRRSGRDQENHRSDPLERQEAVGGSRGRGRATSCSSFRASSTRSSTASRDDATSR